ncbi:MAG: 2Fe-2S iron-sulfur cluster binding domain-containing protein [Ignavibacteria bacterium]|nr:2Fe-2S iron-sulfur cluster binding domain-containing protein [Ignavibacteria bacterium]
MALQFYKIPVAKITRETANAVSIAFAVPANLTETFRYKPGQYLTLRVIIDGKSFNRAYSLCSSPMMGEYHTIAVKSTEDGYVSGFLNQRLREGDMIELMPPMGNFTIDLSPSNERTIVLIGGGSGITPLLSILKSTLATEPKSRILLLYGNRDDSNIIFKSQINSLILKSAGRLNVVQVLEQASSVIDSLPGRLDMPTITQLLKQHIDNQIQSAHYFICGPSGMMAQAEFALDLLSIPKSNVHREYFTLAPSATTEESVPVLTPSEEPQEREVKIRLYGGKHTITVQPKETILAAAIRQHLDPPYACQIAACCTCRAKLVSGKVVMDSREALTDGEIDDGYILTCQSHPQTDDVVVDYDE